jgi:PAS domain S-box-containing protein
MKASEPAGNGRSGATEDALRLAVDTTPAFIHTGRPDGYLDYFNRGWLDLLGKSLDEVCGWRWTESIHPDDVDGIVQKWRAALASGEPFEAEARVRCADGTYHAFLHRKVPLHDEHGNIVKWFGSSIDIEARRRAEEQFRQSDQELQRSEFYLAEGQRLAHMGSWAFDAAGFDYWSPELFRIYGLEPTSTAPTIQEYLNCVHPEDREFMANLIKRVLADASPFDATKRVVRPDGEVRYVRCVGAPVFENQKLKKYIGSALDVTEHELLTQELQRREAYLAEAQRLSHTGSFGWDVSSGEIYWSDETFRIFELDPKTEITTELIVRRTHPDDRQGVQQVIERASRDRTEFALEHRLLMPDGSIKYLQVIGRPSTHEGCATEFVGAVTDITNHRRAEESLRKSEAYLADAQKLSQTGSWAWSPEVGIKYWSEECYRVQGFDPRDGLPRFEELFQRIHPDDQPKLKELMERIVREKIEFETDFRLVHPGGAVRDIHTTGHPVLSPTGDLVEFMGTVIDVTDRKRAEEELRNSEQKYRDLVDTTPAFVHTNLPNGDLDFVNRGWLEYLGLSNTDLLGSRWTSAIHPEDVEELAGKWRAALESGEGYVAEARVRRADGEYRWLLHREEPLRNEAGEIVKWYGSAIEIEERKIAEEKIREQEIELRQILDLTPQHHGVLAPDGSRLYANHTALEYFGITLEQWREPGRVPNSLVHPEDREHFLYERKKRFLEGTPHEFEARLLRHDGEFRWFLFRQTPLKDERGHIRRWYGTATDIEDRKRAEEEIRNENIALREELGKTSMFEEVIGTSSVLQMVLARAAKVAPTDSTVLIMGETGTGKELIARAIHKRSKRSERPFISVNCAAVPSSLIMSELFGHEKGAFTGAVQRRLGRFELAEGGTIFLDEVGDLPMETQIALLRVLQEREFERVGGTEVLRADVRVISATNRDLQTAIADGAFRSDLYYRLNVFPIKLPPLRERQEDVPLLVNYFVDRYAKRAGKKIKHIQRKALEALQGYSWPGNVRELQNVIERSLIICETNEFSIDKSWVANEPQSPDSAPTDHNMNERKRIEAALAQSNGKISGAHGAAAKLGIPASTLESKIRSLRINKFQFKGV